MSQPAPPLIEPAPPLTAPPPARTLRLADVRAWPAALHVATGTALGFVTFPALLTLVLLCAGLIVTVLGALVVFVVLVVVTSIVAAVHRSRFRALLHWHIAAPTRPAAGRNALGTLLAYLRHGAFWRALVYGLIVGTAMLVTGVALAALAGWAAIAATALLHGGEPLGAVTLGSSLRTDLVATAAGVGVLWLLPWLVRAVAWADAVLGAVLLGRSRADDLGRRVERLQESRSEVVDAADAERRRIERDLHDGAQQRLTSLAMNLGIAKATLADLPEPARQALDDAHSEAKAALVELRATVRGLHPAVLDDRGLDAALSGLAGRSPVPVTLTVDLPHRPSRQVEAIAYFVVSEALTNIARHSGASRAEVNVTAYVPSGSPGTGATAALPGAAPGVACGARLRVRITDDGVGGADPSRGTGLTGLRQRVASVDGTLTVESPAGGPTILEVSLPCGS